MKTPPEVTWTLLVKLGSIIVHAEEYASPTGHPFDQQALQSLVTDAEVVEFMEDLRSNGLLPLKRTGESK